MSEQPATTSRVKAGFCGSPASPIFPILAERFDLWLEQERAAARREGQAEAWDEGYRAGSRDMSDLRAGRLTFQTITTNPYEEDRHADQ